MPEIIHGDWPHQRCIEMLAKRIHTIRELRAEVQRSLAAQTAEHQRRVHASADLTSALAERDRARDLAAHLEEELARLRAGIQGDIDSQRAWGFHFVPSPALTGHLEAELAEGQQ